MTSQGQWAGMTLIQVGDHAIASKPRVFWNGTMHEGTCEIPVRMKDLLSIKFDGINRPRILKMNEMG